MLQQVKYADTDFITDYVKKKINLKSINSDIVINIDNEKRIILVRYGICVGELLLNIKSLDNSRLKFKVISNNNCIKKSGIIENGDKLFIKANNNIIVTSQYVIKTQLKVNAEKFNLICDKKIKNNNFVLNLDEFKSNTKIGTSENIDIDGNVTIKGNLSCSNKIVDLKNLIVHGKLIIDIKNGHINLENVKADNINILSAGERSVVFGNNSSTDRLIVTNRKPTHIRIQEGAHVNIGSIFLTPCGNTLEASRVRMSGNFNSTQIIIQRPLILEAGINFEVNSPIRVQNQNMSNQISFAGDFNRVYKVLIEKPVEIVGNSERPPQGLNVEISPDNFYEPVYIKGNFSSAAINVTRRSYIKCNSIINKFVVDPNINSVVMQVYAGTIIANPQISDLVEIEGDENAVNQIVNDAQIYGKGDIVILGVLKPVDFVNGMGKAVRKVSRVGKFNLIVKVKERDGLVVLNQKVPITVIP